MVDFICDKHPTASLFSGSICIGWLIFSGNVHPSYIYIFMVFFCDDRNPSQIWDGLRSSQNPTSQIYKLHGTIKNWTKIAIIDGTILYIYIYGTFLF